MNNANSQLKACFKKEFLAFFRTKKLIILSCVFIGLAIINPVLLKGMDSILDMPEMQAAGLTKESAYTALDGITEAVSNFSSTGLLVFLLVINSFAGGEQKKRSIIIPNCSGLSSFGYLFPKFIVYPLTAFLLTVWGTLVSSGVSSLIFSEGSIEFIKVLCSGVLMGIFVMFYICLHLTLGTATGKAGMSSAVCFVSSVFLPAIFLALGSDLSYNPFGLNAMSIAALYPDNGLKSSDIFITVIIAFVIMAIAFFLALFAQNAKKIDNSGNEILI
ncbi:MAG: hypothetical protein FWG44_03120 [Oscillospiraceae bacterium]|nr:hypothetical protein [Oscillospiraceae bacterium]